MDKRLAHGTNHCKCTCCHAYFSSDTNFRMHRKGSGSLRYCEDPAKIVNKKGIARLRLNTKGIWVSTRVYGADHG